MVTELCDGFSCGSDWDLVEPQSFSGTVTQKEMWSDEPQVKAPPISRRRVMLPTPLQNSYASFEEEQEHFEVEDQLWSARERVVIAKAKRYLEKSESVKVEIEELESQLAQTKRMWILEESMKRQGTKKAARYLRLSAQMVRVHSW